MVKAIRQLVNGKAKIVGGLSVTTVILAISGKLVAERYQNISEAANKVPLIETWIEGHKTWTNTVYPDVLSKIDRVDAHVKEKAEVIERQIIVNTESLGEWKRDRSDSDKEWRDEQRQRNREMLDILRKLDEKSTRP